MFKIKDLEADHLRVTIAINAEFIQLSSTNSGYEFPLMKACHPLAKAEDSDVRRKGGRADRGQHPIPVDRRET